MAFWLDGSFFSHLMYWFHIVQVSSWFHEAALCKLVILAHNILSCIQAASGHQRLSSVPALIIVVYWSAC